MRISEIYTSIQGEGPRVGAPTTFIRFAGCNLRCPLWPCDTQHAIDPELYRNEWLNMTPVDIANKVRSRPINVCLTGGEPFLQPKGELHRLVDLLRNRGHNVECFSNGTLFYPDWALEDVYFVLDWKLPGSGEETIVPIRMRNIDYLTAGDAIKFTVADRHDFDVAVQLYKQHLVDRKPMRAPQIYVGVVWDKVKESELAEWLLEAKLPWKMNVQIHNHIWDRTQRAI